MHGLSERLMVALNEGDALAIESIFMVQIWLGQKHNAQQIQPDQIMN